MRFFLIILLLPSLCFAQHIDDPWETYNRGMFSFNDTMDQYLVEPVAKGYDYVLPRPIKKGIGNFFSNLKYPQYLISDLVQFKFTQALEHTGRFLINSTIGLGGFIDVAEELGIEEHKEDFGLALAYHGVPAGPYWVIPFLGPSNVRDAIGLTVDRLLFPTTFLFYSDKITESSAYIASFSTATLEFVNTRASLIDAIDSAKESSLDYYLFMQSAYYQYREGLLYDGNPPEKEIEDEFDDDFEDDDPFADEYEE